MLILDIGCPVSELFAALRRFQKYELEHDASEDPEEKAAALAALKVPLDETDMKIGRLAWKWIIDTGEVSVGVDGEWNHLTFDEIMSVPEENLERGSNTAAQDSRWKQPLARTAAADGNAKPSKLPKLRPRVYVKEKIVWQTLTGHGPDFKRVPNLEWKLIIAIGATKEEGILQGDLVRATGQDKRSVPKRTDFLSLKGYIAKRTHMVRGTKTSKLWLTRFAPALPAPSNPPGGLDMSAESLTMDMEPVPWKNQWVDNQGKDGKEEIAYMAFGQTIMAIIKAWGTVRIGDLKRKLGIMGRKWQMKVMSKFLRRFDAQGNISYVAATFVGDSFVFKDCVQFQRDPTPADWTNLLATGKKHSQYSDLRDKIPCKSKKLPKKISRSRKGKGKGRARPSNLNKSNVMVVNEKNRNPPSLTEANWVQEKPLANTLAEFVLTGAEEGFTAPEISKATVGSAFRRQVFTHMNNACAPDAQPSNLKEYQIGSQLKIVGKTRARVFIASGARELVAADQSHEEAFIDEFGFGSVQASAFLEDGTSDLTTLGRMEPEKSAKPKRPYVRRKTNDTTNESQDQAVISATLSEAETTSVDKQAETTTSVSLNNGHGKKTKLGSQKQTEMVGTSAEATSARPVRKRKASQRISYADDLDDIAEAHQDVQSDADRTPLRKRRTTQKAGYAELAEDEHSSSDEIEVEEDRSDPGVYFGIPGSLNPDIHKKGRPRKSIVVIFRSDKIKDPDYLPGWSAYPRPAISPLWSIRCAEKPRKKPTQPLAADSDSPILTEGHLRPKQSRQSKSKEFEVRHGAPKSQTSHGGDDTNEAQGAVAENDTELSQTQAAASSTMSILPRGEVATIDSSAASVDQTTKKVSRVHRRGNKSRRGRTDSAMKWICAKCGGEWKNDIGLKYHLEKAKVPCNPYYAEHPDLMVKAKAVRTSRAIFASPEPDAARPSTSNSNSSGSSPQNIGAASRPPSRTTRANNKRTLTPQATESSDLTVPRPVLKQRNILRSRHGVSGIVAPRGVQVSEAAAKDTAVARHRIDPLSSANPRDSMADVVINEQSVLSEDEDVEEELPYMKHIRAEQARSPRKPLLKTSVTLLQDRADSVQTQPEKGEEHRSPALWSASQSMEVDAADTGLSTDFNQASTMVDPYPTDIFEPFAPVSIGYESGSMVENDGHTISLIHSKDSRTPQYANHSVNGVPPFERPPGDKMVNFEGCLASDELALRAIRIAAIIEYLVDVNGGVFQTERALHWAILKVYSTTYPGWPLPTLSGCSRATSDLVALGKLRKDTMAVKTARHWRMVTVVMRPDMEMNMKAVEDLRLVLKTVLPDMYIPPPFAPTESEKILFRERERPLKPRLKGPGRRDHKLAEGIAQLTAPFYAEKGMAGIRPNYRRAKVYSEDEDERPTKRQKSKNQYEVSENGNVAFHPKMRRKHKQLDENGVPVKRRGKQKRPNVEDIIVEPHKLSIDGSHATNPGISSLPASFFSNTAASNNSDDPVPSEIQFYAPNTYLEDDYFPSPEPEEECLIDPCLLASSSINESSVEEYVKPTLPSINDASFTSHTSLGDVKSSKGTWPSISCKWFEQNDGSFTMKGWLPSARDMLLYNLPKTMEQMAFKITSHCKTEQWADPIYGEFCTSVDGCSAYELSEQGQRSLSGSIAPEYLYINFTAKPEVSNMAPCNLQWKEENEWTLETTPYEMLVKYEAGEPNEAETVPLPVGNDGPKPAERKVVASKRKPQEKEKPQRKYIRRADKDPSIRELKVLRELTPYPQQTSDYFRAKGDTSFGVDWKAEDTRIAAYVAVSTLMGGINKAMDWGLVMRIFPEAKLSNLRKFWAMIKKERGGFINSLTDKFQEEFLEAYETGVLKPVDFEDPVAYGEHWLELVRWTLALVVKESIELPANREQFDAELELVAADNGDLDWRDMYHHWQRSVFNKLQDATSEPASTILETMETTVDNDVVIARSWVRALCCTESKEYTPYEIRDKFLSLVREGGRTTDEVNELLETTIFDLEHRRIAIKQKAQALSTGRPYKLNEHFARTLDRFSNEDKFTVAAEFKLKLDNAFREGEMVEIPWRTEDGMVIAAFNLQAYGRVRVEPVKKLEIPFGFKPGFYESRKFPKSYYRFHLRIRPTADYLYNEDIDILERATGLDNIPTETEDGKLPMWCDFFGQPHRGRWFKMLAGVLFTLATRGAMTDYYATQALKPCFEQFEVEMIRKWGLKEGLLREMTVPGGAVCVAEWWWLVAGVPMLEMMTGEEGNRGAVTAGPAAEAATAAGMGAVAGEGVSVARRSKDQYAQPLGRSRRRGKHRVIY